MLVRRSKKLKTDKRFSQDLWYDMVTKFRLQMVDLYKLRSSDRAAWEGRLFHCTTAKGKKVSIVVCSSLYLYEMHWMHSPGHPDLALNVNWQMYLNKTI